MNLEKLCTNEERKLIIKRQINIFERKAPPIYELEVPISKCYSCPQHTIFGNGHYYFEKKE